MKPNKSTKVTKWPTHLYPGRLMQLYGGEYSLMLPFSSALLLWSTGQFLPPKWVAKVVPITQEWRLNVCTDSSDADDQTEMWIRVYRRTSQTKFAPAGRSHLYPTALGYPESYKVFKIHGASARLIVSECDTNQNCFYNVWSFRPETGSFRMVAYDLLNLDCAKARRGVLTERAGSQYVENHGGPGLKHMIARTWRYDPRQNRLVHGKWFNDPQFN